MKTYRTETGRAPIAKWGVCGVLMLAAAVALCSSPGFAQQIEIDLDRNTPGVQSTLTGMSPILGAVVITGVDGDDAGRYSIQVRVRNTTQMTDPINCAGTSATAGDVADGAIGVTFNCSASTITRANLFSTNVPLGADGVASMFLFDLDVDCNDDDEITLELVPTSENVQLGVNVNGSAQTIGGTLPSVGATFTCGEEGGGEEPTPRERCVDAGLYVLDSFGGRHQVGAPRPITGSLYFGFDAARDMELVTYADPVEVVESEDKGVGPQTHDIVVLDLNGVVHYVANESAAPGQSFFFPDGPAPVDVEVALDGLGYWVLLANGSIYAAGSAGSGLVGQTGTLGLDFPFGGAVPRDPNLDAAQGSVRAVGFGVFQPTVMEAKGNGPAGGIVILDSQGGHYLFDGEGNTISEGSKGFPGGTAFDPATVYPFFQGLDIARDIELHPNTPSALIIYDGWGGTHPVPVSGNSAVDFINNTGPSATTVGLPYIQSSFGEEGSDVDVGSIFRDLEFCTYSTDDSNAGIYVLDAFGAIFAFGSTRQDQFMSPAPIFNNAPYFFPNQYAVDMEPTRNFPDPQ